MQRVDWDITLDSSGADLLGTPTSGEDEMTRVLMVGSVNMDLVVETGTFPRLGETLFGAAFATHPGGKGANQAVAAARLGAGVTMLGRVGSDAFGRELRAELAHQG